MHLSESLILDILNYHHFSQEWGNGKFTIGVGMIVSTNSSIEQAFLETQKVAVKRQIG